MRITFHILIAGACVTSAEYSTNGDIGIVEAAVRRNATKEAAGIETKSFTFDDLTCIAERDLRVGLESDEAHRVLASHGLQIRHGTGSARGYTHYYGGNEWSPVIQLESRRDFTRGAVSYVSTFQVEN